MVGAAPFNRIWRALSSSCSKRLPMRTAHRPTQRWGASADCRTAWPRQRSNWRPPLRLIENLVGALRQLGQTMMYLGQPEAGIPYIEKALLLSPRDSDLASVYRALGMCHLLLGHADQAVELLSRARAENPRFWYIHYWLSAALGLRGELDEARAGLAESIRLDPEVNSL